MTRSVTTAFCLAVTTTLAQATTYHVAVTGNDDGPGTAAQPFRTIGHATGVLKPGDTCLVHAGTYREAVRITEGGTKDAPLRIAAAPGERVVLDGRDAITSVWAQHEGNVYKTIVSGPVEQVFLGDRMLVEARWPNMRFPDELWDRSKWARAGKESTKGLMMDPALAQTGIDWTGALAVLNISHQWWTWTSPVLKHGAGKDRFEYDTASLSGVFGPTPYYRFDDDFYYLTGKLAALDAPGEWFHDAATNTLYVQPFESRAPVAGEVSVKRRDYAFEAKNADHVILSGFHFVGCAFRFRNCHHCVVEDCHLLYAGYSREIKERYTKPKRGKSPGATIRGNHNVVRRCSMAFSSGNGLVVTGAHNLVEENLIHDVCWSGSLDYNAIHVNGRGYGDSLKGQNVIRRNTVFNGGSALIHLSGPKNVVELNHVYGGGRACSDVSLVYTSLPLCAGTEIRYNWVHDCHAPHIALGIRGDDKTRELIVHHNVTWNCGWEGIIVKGDRNVVFNNTSYSNGKSDILLFCGPEPDKDWHKKWPPVPKENEHSRVFNNLTQSMRGHRNKELPPGGELANNLESEDMLTWLVDAENLDFRPKPGTPPVDAGTVIDSRPAAAVGKAPDVGAYEADGERWAPGITWDPGEVLGRVPTGYVQVPGKR